MPSLPSSTLAANKQRCLAKVSNVPAAAILSSALLLTSCSSLSVNSNHTTPQAAKNGPVVALVLGGGGAKGFAHVGVIKVLEKNGIHPDLVVGSSVGSFVGSIYSSGKSAKKLEQVALDVTNAQLADFTLAHQGIIEGHKLRQFINAQVNNQPIEAFPTRFAVVATEKNSLKKAVFTKGEAGLLVQASSSVPNIFIAPRIPDKVGKKYIDGGVSSMVPVDAARDLGADVVIAVDVMSESGKQSKRASNHRNFWSLLDQAYAKEGKYTQGKYSQNSSAPMQAEVNRADVIIRPNVDFISTFDTSRRQQAIKAGEAAANASLVEIKQALREATAEFAIHNR